MTLSVHVPAAGTFKGIRTSWRWLFRCLRWFVQDTPDDVGTSVGIESIGLTNVKGASSQRDGIGTP